MHLRSMYPDMPPTPDGNAHHVVFNTTDRATWPDFTRFIDASTGKRYSDREFLESVYDGATALGTPISEGGLGLRAEDREIVGILSDNCVEYITLIHALLAIVVPFSLLSSYSTPYELEHALRLSDITRLFVQPKFLPLAFRAASKVGLPHSKIYVLGGKASGRKSLSEMIHDVRVKRIPRLAVRPAKRDTLAYLIFSSGTSGLPKAVMISHGNLIFTFLQAAIQGQETAKIIPPELIQNQAPPIVLMFLPLHHTYGLQLFAFRSVMQMATLIILPRWNVEAAMKAVPKFKINYLPLIPSVVVQTIDYLRTHKVDMSSVQIITCGAAHLPSTLAQKLTKSISRDVQLQQGYGMSEATFVVTGPAIPGMLGGRVKAADQSTGILHPGMEARIVREDGSEASFGEPGNLYVKGDNVGLGYWKNTSATAETFMNGWLKTGDRFRVDEDGNFFFEDRAKDTLKVSGEQVSPKEIEDVLMTQPDELITEAAVAGVSGGRTADERIPRAWIILSEAGKKRGATTVIKVLDAWTRTNLSKFKWLRGGIEVVREIPKSPTGKVLRRVLQEKYEAKRSQPIARVKL